MRRRGRSLSLRLVLDFVACIGQEQSLSNMFSRVISELPRLIPCDQSFSILGDTFSQNGPGNVFTISAGVPETVKRAYLEYYYKTDILHSRLQRMPPKTPYFAVDWRDRTFDKYEFAADFVRKLAHIDVCAGIPFYDSTEYPTAVTAVLELTRSGGTMFSSREERVLRFIQPHITNYYTILKRLERYPKHSYMAAELASNCKLLSRREAEICSLLCKRLRPNEIATLLMISPRTVERHVENIYDKLGVRSRKELLVRLLT